MDKMKRLIALFGLISAVCSCGPGGNLPEKSPMDEDINIGYGTTKRKDLGFAVDKVTVQEDVISSYSNIAEYLRGRVPGLEINSNGGIQIRGNNSLEGPSDALVLVDNVPCANINSINVMDIASVEVLKDASASIYGSRGANGVVLITTKGEMERKKIEAEAKEAERKARLEAKKAAKEAKKAAKNAEK